MILNGAFLHASGIKQFTLHVQMQPRAKDHRPLGDYYLTCAQLFEGRLALNPGLNLTQLSFSFVRKHFLRKFSLLFLRESNHHLVDREN